MGYMTIGDIDDTNGVRQEVIQLKFESLTFFKDKPENDNKHLKHRIEYTLRDNGELEIKNDCALIFGDFGNYLLWVDSKIIDADSTSLFKELYKDSAREKFKGLTGIDLDKYTIRR